MIWPPREHIPETPCPNSGPAQQLEHSMQVLDILKATGGLDAIANQLGIPPAMAEAGAGALLPAVLGGLKKQDEAAPASSGGLADILGSLGGAGLAANVLGSEPTNIDRGNDVLGQIFGSKDVSRTVAGHAAEQSGVDASVLKKMLPILAMLVAGYLAHQKGVGGGEAEGGTLGGGLGGLGSILGSVLGGGGQASAPASGGMLGQLGSLLDMDGDGNPLDDIMGMAGKFMK